MEHVAKVADKLADFSQSSNDSQLTSHLLKMKQSSQSFSSENIDIKSELQQISAEYDRLVYESRNLAFNHNQLQADLKNCESYESIYEQLEFSQDHESTALPLEHLRSERQIENELDPYFDYLYAEMEKRKQEISKRAQVQDRVNEMREEVLNWRRKLAQFDDGVDRVVSSLQEQTQIFESIKDAESNEMPVESEEAMIIN